MAKCVILEYYLIEPEPVVLQCFCFSTEAEVHDPSTLQQSLTVIHMEQKKKKKKEDSALSTNDWQSVCTTKRTEKKI